MLKPAETPKLKLELPELTTSSVAHPDTWNPTHQTLLNNDAALHGHILENEQELAAVRESLGARLSELEAGSAIDTQHALELDWLYRKDKFYVEIWRPGFTLTEPISQDVITAIQGDDSLDLSSTEGIQQGDHYVLNVEGEVPLIVKITAVLSQSRVRISQDLPAQYSGGQIIKTTFAIDPLAGALCQPNDVWLSRMISLGSSGALIVRRTLNSAAVKFYWRTASTDWQESIWVTRRQVIGNSGFADYEYSIPADGDIWLRIDVSGEPVTIKHIIALGQATGHGGFVNDQARPATPAMSTPSNGSVDVSITPTLSLSGFSSVVGNRLGASKFQLATDEDFANVDYETDWLPLSLSVSLTRGVVTPGATHFVRGKVKDAAGLESDWSTPVQFTVSANISHVVTPSVLSPGAGALNVDDSPTVLLSAFQSDGGDPLTHQTTEIQIKKISGSWSSPTWASGELGSVVSYRVPDGVLQPKTSYAIRARYRATSGAWSEWSNENSFTTREWFISDAIGVAMVPEGSRYVLKHIDEYGRLLEEGSLPKSYFDNHPVFGGIQDVLIEGNHMVKIPRYWYRRAKLTVVPYLNPVDSWVISPIARIGYTLHPAFKKYHPGLRKYSDGTSPFFVAKYLSSLEYAQPTWGVTSRPGREPLVNSGTQWSTLRNGFTGGWGWTNYFDLACIQMLFAIEHASFDCQEITGSANYDGSNLTVDHPSAQKASYRGIIGLWGGVEQMLDGGLSGDNGSGNNLHIGNTTSDRSTFAMWLSPSIGYPVEFLDGAPHWDATFTANPNTLTSDPAFASVPSEVRFSSGAQVLYSFGGPANKAGLWSVNATNTANFAARLTKHDV